MKTILKSAAFLMLVVFVTLPACKKDKSSEELIIGKWEVQTAHSIEYKNGVKTSDTIDTYTSKQMEIEIKSGGTGTEYENQVANDQFTWTVSGNTVTITSTSAGQTPQVATFTVTQNNLTITSSQTEVFGGITYKYETTLSARRE